MSLLGALCVAELGAALPEAGGQFAYLREAYGPLWAYLYGWGAGIVINPASIAAISVVCATYLGYFIPLSTGAIPWVAAATTVVLTVLNCLGVRPGTLTQNILTSLKIGLVLLLIVAGLALPGGASANLHPVWPAGSPLGRCSTESFASTSPRSASRWFRCCGRTTAGSRSPTWGAR